MPVCLCDFECPLDYKPVCANDGQTYLNECYMRLESCRQNKKLKIYRAKECSQVSNPCQELECEKYFGSFCRIDQTGIAACQCEETCEEVF